MRFRKLHHWLTQKETIVLFFIVLVALFLRLYRLRELATFIGDQGIDLLAIRNIVVNHKPTLIGPITSLFPIYNGPAYYYLALPFLVLLNFDPIGVSYMMVGLSITTIILIYYLVIKYANYLVAGLTTLVYVSWPVAVNSARSSFSSAPTPLFSTLLVYQTINLIKKPNPIKALLFGIVSGIVLQFHYQNIMLPLLLVLYIFYKKQLTLKIMFFIGLGFLLGFSPLILFEARHNLFNTRLLLGSLGKSGFSGYGFNLHYFSSLYPLILLGFAWFTNKIYGKYKIAMIILYTLIVTINFSKLGLNNNHGDSMPEGWNIIGVEKASRIIASDAQTNFNVASIIDGDTRAYPFRYYLDVYNKKTNSVEAYSTASELYVISKLNHEAVLNYPVWEIQSFMPAKINNSWSVQNGFYVYKLIKTYEK